jgi:hypothetical protein
MVLPHRLEDAGDGQAGLGGVVDGSRGGAAGETLDVHGPAGIKYAEPLRRQVMPRSRLVSKRNTSPGSVGSVPV